MQSIDALKLEDILRRISRSNMVSFTAITEPDMRKRDNPYCTKHGRQWVSNVRKVSFLVSSLINVSFNRIVDRRRLEEFQYSGQLKPSRKRNPRAWGAHESDGPLVFHEVNGDSRLYLHVVVQRRFDHFFDTTTNKKLQPSDLAGWLNPRDSGYANQGLNRPVVVKDFALKNVAELTANGNRYTIAPAATELERYLPRTKPTATASRRRATVSSPKHQPAGGRS